MKIHGIDFKELERKKIKANKKEDHRRLKIVSKEKEMIKCKIIICTIKKHI